MVNTKIRTPYMVAQEKLKEKEIIATKKYLKKIWGEDIPLKKMTYKEIKKLSWELGMNTFKIKNFNIEKGNIKKCIRTCKYCNKNYEATVKIKTHARGKGVCPSCKNKTYKKRWVERRHKTTTIKII